MEMVQLVLLGQGILNDWLREHIGLSLVGSKLETGTKIKQAVSC
jgi:hypothetical protein